MDVEEATVRAFMLRDRRDRWIAALGSAGRRRKVTDRLAHLRDLDPRYAHRLGPSGQDASAILDELRRRGAPATCHVISENTSLDARDLPLEDVLDEVVGSMHGTIVICVAGQLAYYEGEDQGERYILERPGRSWLPNASSRSPSPRDPAIGAAGCGQCPTTKREP